VLNETSPPHTRAHTHSHTNRVYTRETGHPIPSPPSCSCPSKDASAGHAVSVLKHVDAHGAWMTHCASHGGTISAHENSSNAETHAGVNW
jgi:hypothetical protein